MRLRSGPATNDELTRLIYGDAPPTAVLAVVMRQRDDYERAIEVLARKVADLKEQRRQERLARRYWLTRTITPQKVSQN
ncbi:MAG: hypothetical protein E6Q97_14155 [Desulfurellales bacterium]|nr:MAG: hypothetical protein E6Q97_14155 [Desulfurellales bacterium]